MQDEELRVDYSTGETIFVHVSGSAYEIDVALDNALVDLPPTYVTLFSQKVIKIVNNSDETISFDWRTFDSVEQETRAQLSVMLDGGSSAISKAQLERELLFKDDTFMLEPIAGTIYPHKSREITATFSPSVPIFFLGCLFDVSGCCAPQRVSVFARFRTDEPAAGDT